MEPTKPKPEGSRSDLSLAKLVDGMMDASKPEYPFDNPNPNRELSASVLRATSWLECPSELTTRAEAFIAVAKDLTLQAALHYMNLGMRHVYAPAFIAVDASTPEAVESLVFAVMPAAMHEAPGNLISMLAFLLWEPLHDHDESGRCILRPDSLEKLKGIAKRGRDYLAHQIQERFWMCESDGPKPAAA